MIPFRHFLIDLGEANPKQALFFRSEARFTAFGGARGGGKSHAVRIQAVRGAFIFPGIRILIIRRTYNELENSIIDPFLKLIPPQLFSYNASKRLVDFINGSSLRFGHFSPSVSELEYQGQEFDWIFIDEATQISERQFRVMGACLRGVNDIPKRMYLTCNPGGIGHTWVKRLFIDRIYRNSEADSDYFFIPATVEDNRHLMAASPEYISMLDSLPEDMRRAHRFGDWNVLSGQFFSDFRERVHVIPFFDIPKNWYRYRAFDYGLDMFACIWVAVSPDGFAFVYREFQEQGLIVSQAADIMRNLTLPSEHILCTIAPPDIWSSQKDSGRTMADIFADNGVPLSKASNSRVHGFMMIKELLRINESSQPRLKIFDSCKALISNLQLLQHDRDNPSDCAVRPHDITHITDALRYFAVFRYGSTPKDSDDSYYPYDDFMKGGPISPSYIFR